MLGEVFGLDDAAVTRVFRNNRFTVPLRADSRAESAVHQPQANRSLSDSS